MACLWCSDEEFQGFAFQVLESLCEDTTSDNSRDELWEQITPDLCYCMQCVRMYHEIKDRFLQQKKEKHFAKELYKLDVQRLEGQLSRLLTVCSPDLSKEGNIKLEDTLGLDKSEAIEILMVPLYEILQYPYLMFHRDIYSLFIKSLDLTLAQKASMQPDERLPGFYYLLFCPVLKIMRWAKRNLEDFGELNEDDAESFFDVISSALNIPLKVLGSKVLNIQLSLPMHHVLGTDVPLPNMYTPINLRKALAGLETIVNSVADRTLRILLTSGTNIELFDCLLSILKQDHQGDDILFWAIVKLLQMLMIKLASALWITATSELTPYKIIDVILSNVIFKKRIGKMKEQTLEQNKLELSEDTRQSGEFDFYSVKVKRGDADNKGFNLFGSSDITFSWMCPLVISVLDVEDAAEEVTGKVCAFLKDAFGEIDKIEKISLLQAHAFAALASVVNYIIDVDAFRIFIKTADTWISSFLLMTQRCCYVTASASITSRGVLTSLCQHAKQVLVRILEKEFESGLVSANIHDTRLHFIHTYFKGQSKEKTEMLVKMIISSAQKLDENNQFLLDLSSGWDQSSQHQNQREALRRNAMSPVVMVTDIMNSPAEQKAISEKGIKVLPPAGVSKHDAIVIGDSDSDDENCQGRSSAMFDSIENASNASSDPYVDISDAEDDLVWEGGRSNHSAGRSSPSFNLVEFGSGDYTHPEPVIENISPPESEAGASTRTPSPQNVDQETNFTENAEVDEIFEGIKQDISYAESDDNDSQIIPPKLRKKQTLESSESSDSDSVFSIYKDESGSKSAANTDKKKLSAADVEDLFGSCSDIGEDEGEQNEANVNGNISYQKVPYSTSSEISRVDSANKSPSVLGTKEKDESADYTPTLKDVKRRVTSTDASFRDRTRSDSISGTSIFDMFKNENSERVKRPSLEESNSREEVSTDASSVNSLKNNISSSDPLKSLVLSRSAISSLQEKLTNLVKSTSTQPRKNEQLNVVSSISEDNSRQDKPDPVVKAPLSGTSSIHNDDNKSSEQVASEGGRTFPAHDVEDEAEKASQSLLAESHLSVKPVLSVTEKDRPSASIAKEGKSAYKSPDIHLDMTSREDTEMRIRSGRSRKPGQYSNFQRLLSMTTFENSANTLKLPDLKPKQKYREELFECEILKWQTRWMKNGPNDDIHITLPMEPRRVLNTYNTMEDYMATQLPLLLMDTFADIARSWQEMGKDHGKGFDTSVNSVETPNVNCRYYIYRCTIVTENRFLVPRTSDLVMLAFQAKEEFMTEVFAIVESVRREQIPQRLFPSENILSQKNLNLYNLTMKAMEPITVNDQPVPIRGVTILSLAQAFRKWEALRRISKSLLAKDLLCPFRLSVFDMTAYDFQMRQHFNKSQSKAIQAIRNAVKTNYVSPKVCLLQGPPGTGKTHTLKEIIKGILLDYYEKTNEKPRILVCAPSNAAVDEISRRLLSDPPLSKQKKSNDQVAEEKRLRYHNCGDFNLVRVGVESKMHQQTQKQSFQFFVGKELSKRSYLFNKAQAAEERTKLIQEIKELDKQCSQLKMSSDPRKRTELNAKMRKRVEVQRSYETIMRQATKHQTREEVEYQVKRSVLMYANVICCTLSGAGSADMTNIFRNFEGTDCPFYCIIIDEAGQCCEPEALIPLQYGASKLVLVGDHAQLPATVLSRRALGYGYGMSLFERLFGSLLENCKTSCPLMLEEQYRMHDEICRFPSNRFYEGRLQTSWRVRERKQAPGIRPYVVLDVKDGKEISSFKGSLHNPLERKYAAFLCEQLRKTNIFKLEDIGIISPYRKQVELMRAELNSRNMNGVEVDSIDGFQGREKNCIFLTCVRARAHNDTVGFLQNPQRLNVALTRARRCLIILLHANSLKIDDDWCALLDDARERSLLYSVKSEEEICRAIFLQPNPQTAWNQNGYATISGTSYTAHVQPFQLGYQPSSTSQPYAFLPQVSPALDSQEAFFYPSSRNGACGHAQGKEEASSGDKIGEKRDKNDNKKGENDPYGKCRCYKYKRGFPEKKIDLKIDNLPKQTDLPPLPDKLEVFTNEPAQMLAEFNSDKTDASTLSTLGPDILEVREMEIEDTTYTSDIIHENHKGTSSQKRKRDSGLDIADESTRAMNEGKKCDQSVDSKTAKFSIWDSKAGASRVKLLSDSEIACESMPAKRAKPAVQGKLANQAKGKKPSVNKQLFSVTSGVSPVPKGAEATKREGANAGTVGIAKRAKPSDKMPKMDIPYRKRWSTVPRSTDPSVREHTNGDSSENVSAHLKALKESIETDSLDQCNNRQEIDRAPSPSVYQSVEKDHADRLNNIIHRIEQRVAVRRKAQLMPFSHTGWPAHGGSRSRKSRTLVE